MLQPERQAAQPRRKHKNSAVFQPAFQRRIRGKGMTVIRRIGGKGRVDRAVQARLEHAGVLYFTGRASTAGTTFAPINGVRDVPSLLFTELFRPIQ